MTPEEAEINTLKAENKHLNEWNRILFIIGCLFMAFIFFVIIHYGKSKQETLLLVDRNKRLTDSVKAVNLYSRLDSLQYEVNARTELKIIDL